MKLGIHEHSSGEYIYMHSENGFLLKHRTYTVAKRVKVSE